MESGLHVTHIDGHQHMHVLPTVLPIVIEQANSMVLMQYAFQMNLLYLSIICIRQCDY